MGICGEAAGMKTGLPIWLGLGIDALSMSSPSVLTIREALSNIDSKEAEKVAKEALKCSNQREVLQLVREKFNIE